MKNECAILMKKYLDLDRDDWKGGVVKKQYAFELAEIPTELTDYYEVSYSFKVKS
jgi:hypothetical protein